MLPVLDSLMLNEARGFGSTLEGGFLCISELTQHFSVGGWGNLHFNECQIKSDYYNLFFLPSN